MPLVVVDIQGGSKALNGALMRRLTQIRAGVFVGCLSVRGIEQIWHEVIEASPDSALLVQPAKNDLGMAFKVHGKRPHYPCDFDGIQLLKIAIKNKDEKSV